MNKGFQSWQLGPFAARNRPAYIPTGSVSGLTAFVAHLPFNASMKGLLPSMFGGGQEVVMKLL
jgi:hypothetical protein